MWILFGAASILFTALNLWFSFRNHRLSNWANFCALSFTSLTAIAEYSLVNNWVRKEDWTALMDVVPTMNNSLTTYVFLMIFINLIAMALKERHQSKSK